MKLVYLFLFLTTITFSCRKDKASWDADYMIPLINDSLTLVDYVNDSTLGLNTSGNYQLDLHRELFRFDLSNEVEIPDTTITSSFSNALTFNVPPGFSIIDDAQEKSLSLSNLELSTIYIEKGQIEVTVKNTYPTNVIAKILLPKTTKSGVIVTDELTIGPGTVANPSYGTKTIDVAYANMDLTGLNSNSFNKFVYNIIVKSDPNGPSVQSTSSNVTVVTSKIKNLELFYAKGYFGNRKIKDTVETDVEILKNWISGGLDVQDVDLNIKITNSIKAMGRIKIVDLTTEKSNGTVTHLNSSQMNVAQNVNSAAGAWSTLSSSFTNFSFTSTNSNIEDFIENAGPKIKVIYEFELNPLGNNTLSNNEVFPESAVILDLDLKMPLTIGLDELTLQDTLSVNFAKNKTQLERAKKAQIIVDTENGFPIKGEIMLKVLNDLNETVLTIPNSGIIQSGLTGIPNSYGLYTSKDKILWDLDEAQIIALQNGTKMVVTGVFNTPDPSTSLSTPLPIKEKSFLSTKVYLSLTYQNEL